MPSSEPALAEDRPAYVLASCECPTHGSYKAYRTSVGAPPLVHDCPKCIDELTARYAADKRTRNEQQMRSRRLKEILGFSGIPARFTTRTLDNYDAVSPGQQLALTVCKTYASTWPEQVNKGGSLVLTGKCGTGKTHLACAIANAIIPEHLATVVFGTVAKLVRSVRSTYGGRGAKSEQQALDDLLRPDLLIVDEVGVQSGSEHELAMLFEIFNERCQNLRPTIVISNLNKEELEKFLGQRVMERFRECGLVLSFDWESHRGKGITA